MSNFISKLKVGDTVIVGNYTFMHVAQVEDITLNGFIQIDGNLYDKNGTEKDGDWRYATRLFEATPEAVASVKELKTIRKALKAMRNTQTITFEQALEILSVLGVEA